MMKKVVVFFFFSFLNFYHISCFVYLPFHFFFFLSYSTKSDRHTTENDELLRFSPSSLFIYFFLYSLYFYSKSRERKKNNNINSSFSVNERIHCLSMSFISLCFSLHSLFLFTHVMEQKTFSISKEATFFFFRLFSFLFFFISLRLKTQPNYSKTSHPHFN